MANLGQLEAVTRRYFVPKLADNIFVGTPELRRAKEKGVLKKIDTGTKIVAPLEYASLAAQWYTGSETLTIADTDTFDGAEYTLRQMHVPVLISGLDKIKNMGDAQVIDFVKSKMKNAEKAMRQTLSLGYFNAGSNANEIVGLRAIVGTSNTIGNISQTSNSWWAGQVDSTTTTLTISALQTLFMLCSEDSEEPSVIFATKANYNRYYALLQPQQRFADSDSAAGGFSSLLFNSKPFIACSNAPSSHIFMLNESYLSLWVHKERDMVMSAFQQPINQDAEVAKLLWAGAMGSTNNRYHGKLSAIAA